MSQKRRTTVVDPRQSERRRSLMIKIGTALVLIVVAVAVGVWAVNSGDGSSSSDEAVPDPTPIAELGDKVPTVATESGALRVTSAPADSQPPATLSIYEDFQCPACQQFEATHGEAISSLYENPNVVVEYTQVTMLDRGGQSDFSARTTNASMCVAENTATDGDWMPWITFHNSLYEYLNTNNVSRSGPSNSRLIELANEAGATDVTECIENQDFGQWIDRKSNETQQNPAFQGTPTVMLNGAPINWQATSPEDLVNQVNEIAVQ